MTYIIRTKSGCLLTALFAVALLPPADAVWAADQHKPIEVIVYPILVEAPLFGASIDLPQIPSLPGGGEGGDQSNSTSVSLNALYQAGISVRANRWFGEARGTWGNISATRTTPRVTLDSKARVFVARGGVTLADGFSVTGGVRRIWGALSASLTLPNLDNRTLTASIDKALWDPLIGVDWYHHAGKFIFEGNFEGGGFGVGADADVSGGFDVTWRFTPHTDLRAGWTVFYYKYTVGDVNIGSFQRTIVASQTLNGPSLAFGIVF